MTIGATKGSLLQYSSVVVFTSMLKCLTTKLKCNTQMYENAC